MMGKQYVASLEAGGHFGFSSQHSQWEITAMEGHCHPGGRVSGRRTYDYVWMVGGKMRPKMASKFCI